MTGVAAMAESAQTAYVEEYRRDTRVVGGSLARRIALCGRLHGYMAAHPDIAADLEAAIAELHRLGVLVASIGAVLREGGDG